MSAVTDVIPFETADPLLDWLALTDALETGHALARAELQDVFLQQAGNTLLNRSAWISGLGMAVKCATVFPGNRARDMPAVNGGVMLFSERDGSLYAIIDFHLVTKWKTAGDSLLAARKLARPNSREILIVGAGTVARSLLEAYSAAFPKARFHVWNRSPEGAAAFQAQFPQVQLADDLETAVRQADIITSATLSSEPIIHGNWLQPGQHLDLIGAFKADMREADDEVLRRGRLFVDSRDTTLRHIGELKIPLQTGVISEGDIIADFYEPKKFCRLNDDEITVFKNGGGAHLDLMTSNYIQQVWAENHDQK